jgi:hypothetical protein
MLIYMVTFPEDATNVPYGLDVIIFIGLPLSIFVTNITFTALICGRLIHYQLRLKKLMGPQQSSQYTTIAAMVVESASINIIFQLLATVAIFIPPPESGSVFNIYFLGQTTVSKSQQLLSDESVDADYI